MQVKLWISLSAVLVFLAGAAFAQDDAGKYGGCIALVGKNASEALESATAWERQGGGDPARHCKSLALIGVGEVEDGALELERMAAVQTPDKAVLAADLFAQAAQAWIRVDNLERALHDQNEGLKLDPKNVGLLVDRAVTYGLSGKYFEALDDLNTAHDLSPKDPDILAFRAAAYRRLESLDLAQDNVDQALSLSPDHALALLERGYLRAAKGDHEGARADWLAVTQKAAGTDLGSEAQANLEKLDLKVE